MTHMIKMSLSFFVIANKCDGFVTRSAVHGTTRCQTPALTSDDVNRSLVIIGHDSRVRVRRHSRVTLRIAIQEYRRLSQRD